MSFDLDAIDSLDDGSLSPFVDVGDVDPEVNLYLDKLFEEEKRSGVFTIHGEEKRIRMDESVRQCVWDDMSVTYCNIGACDGQMGRGVLFERTNMSHNTETKFLKALRFEDIALYTILKNLISTSDITLKQWQKFRKDLRTRDGETNIGDDRKTFRFDGANGVKLNMGTSSKIVADCFHDSMHGFGVVSTRHRKTEGLSSFRYPGCECVSAARKKLFFLLPCTYRVAFCAKQMFGTRDIFDARVLSLGYSSPDDVGYEQELSICPLGYTGTEMGDQVVVKIKDPTIVEEPPLKKQRSDASRSREGSRAEDYLKEQAEKAKDEANAAKDEAKAAKQEAQQLREQLAALKVARETPQAAQQEEADIGIKIEEDSDDDSSVDSEERERYFRELDEQEERYQRARDQRDQREIEQFGMEIHQKMKRRRLSQYDATHILTFREFRNTYRTMREKRDLQIELRVWLPVFLFACYFAVCEYGVAYIHEHDIVPSLDGPMRGNDIFIYIGILLCAGIMVVIFAFSNPTVCDWFYGLVITPATRLCFASNQGYASMIIIVLLCSQKIKWLLALEFVGVVVFVVIAPLANRFIFMARLLLTLVFYQNRLINHLDQRTPTIFLSVWRELILTLMFVVHFVFDKLELFFCGCAGHE